MADSKILRAVKALANELFLPKSSPDLEEFLKKNRVQLKGAVQLRANYAEHRGITSVLIYYRAVAVPIEAFEAFKVSMIKACPEVSDDSFYIGIDNSRLFITFSIPEVYEFKS